MRIKYRVDHWPGVQMTAHVDSKVVDGKQHVCVFGSSTNNVTVNMMATDGEIIDLFEELDARERVIDDAAEARLRRAADKPEPKRVDGWAILASDRFHRPHWRKA